MRRVFCPGASLAAGGYGWYHLHEPGNWAGLVVLVLLASLLVLAVAFSVVSFRLTALVPRQRRADFRRWRIHRTWPKPIPRAQQKSSTIPRWLRDLVLYCDRHRCVHCGAFQAELNVDHLIPWSVGGLTALFNLVTLCERCNLIKTNVWIRRNGTVGYRPPSVDARRLQLARAIAGSEYQRQLSPLRWIRAAYSLGWI